MGFDDSAYEQIIFSSEIRGMYELAFDVDRALLDERRMFQFPVVQGKQGRLIDLSAGYPSHIIRLSKQIFRGNVNTETSILDYSPMGVSPLIH